jgi:maltose alpha-D-glucosyltransferase/alpha-amylase
VIALPPVERARIDEWLRASPAPIDPAWLRTQRWFGGKARPIDCSRVADVVWIGIEPRRSALVVLDVHYGGDTIRGDPVERYALLAGVDDTVGDSLIGRLPWPPGLVMIEAATHADAIGDLLGALALDAHHHGVRGGELRRADVTAATRHLAREPSGPLAIRAVGLEQSNTSVRVDQEYVFKLIRRLQPGEHPQLEVGRFLSRAGFHWVPPLHGSLIYRAPGGGEYAIGVLEGWVENAGDGWSYVVTSLDSALREGASLTSLATSLGTLGAITAELHVAMASGSEDAFAPEAVTQGDVQQWSDTVRAHAARLMQIIATDHTGWPPPAAALGRSVIELRDRLAPRVEALGASCDPHSVRKIRIHGDYHLGQTLKTAGGFTLIDFEGEPAKPLAERRRKHCALKDVAGLLRSLDYAEATVAAGRTVPAQTGRVLRTAFLDGYYADPRLATFLPRAREAGADLLSLFELEKTLYEIEYELNNRPDWLHIPLGAVRRYLDAPA